MEHLLEGLFNRNSIIQCHKFIEKNSQIIEDVMLMNKPLIKPLFNIKSAKALKNEITKNIGSEFVKKAFNKNKLDKAEELMYWRYFCSSFPDKKLLVLLNGKLDKKDEKNCLFKFETKVSSQAVKNMELQIMFSRLPFNDFIQYLFDNAERFKQYRLEEYKSRDKNESFRVYVMSKVDGRYNEFYMSEDFYDLVEGSKIFLHYNNYEYYEEQHGFCYGNDLLGSIRTFFCLKFLKFFMYKNYSLLAGEYMIVTGSFFLFAMGFRKSRDIDIYSLVDGNLKRLRKVNMNCKYDIQEVRGLENKILEPENYGIYFGFKGNLKKDEIKKRQFRYEKGESRKALADLYILRYFYGNKINVENRDRLLQYRYKKLIRE